MKRIIVIVFLSVLTVACSKEVRQEDIEVPEEPQIPSIPEKVEADLLDVVSHDWEKLADTVSYYYDNLLSKGHIKGFGPDSVWYELALKEAEGQIKVDFYVADSIWFRAAGSLNPLQIEFNAYETSINIRRARADSLSLGVKDIAVTVPMGFGVVEGKSCNLYYQERKVGFVVIEEFENEDYSTGYYLVVRYFDDPRSFSYYDNGFIRLIGKLDELQ